MALTPQIFRGRYPEFDHLKNVELVDALARAQRRISATPSGDLRDDAQGQAAAHILARSAFGMQARLEPEFSEEDLNTTTYGGQFKDSLRMLTPTIMVV